MKSTKTLFLFAVVLLFSACSGKQADNREIAAGENPAEQFEQKLDALSKARQTPETLAEKEKTHLDYGIYLIYNSDPASMRENANEALRQFAAALRINPDNDKAAAEIEQILGVYRSIPGRAPADDVAQELRELGFDI